MPLPVSAQGYMPNPLLFAEASQAGLNYGQDIVSGAIGSAQGVANLASTVQDIEMKPKKLEMEQQQINQQDRQLDQADTRIGIEQQRADIAQQAEDRNYEQMGINEGLRQQELDIKRDRVKRAGLTLGIQAKNRADKEVFDEVATNFILDRDIDSVMGSLGDISTPAGRRRQSKFMNHLLDDKELAQGFVTTAEESLANDNLAPQQRKFLEEQVKFLGMHSKVRAQGELAEQGAAMLRSSMGVNIEKGEILDWRKDPASNEIHVQSKKPGSDKWKPLGVYTDTTEAGRQKFYTSMQAINRANEIEKENREQVVKSIQATAEKDNRGLRISGQKSTEASQQERPTKEAPAAVMRRGMQRGAPTVEDENRAIEQTGKEMRSKPLTAQQRAARRRAQKLVGAKVDAEAEGMSSNYSSELPRPGREPSAQ